MMDEFTSCEIQADDASIFVRYCGSGTPILLLHGFPQTHLMWRGVAPLLARNFTVVCADLRGYGRSSCPASDPDHKPYAKRAMALRHGDRDGAAWISTLLGRWTRLWRARRLSHG